jgi:uncharacterized protein (DUF983 family)
MTDKKLKKLIKIHTEIVNGICSECEEYTMLVGITRKFYRCMSCGSDLEQHVNGKISYIPTITARTPKSKVEDYFNGEEI